MYTLIEKEYLHYSPFAITDLEAISDVDIAKGDNNLGSGLPLLVADQGIRVRNKAGKTLFAFQNTHPSVNAYAKILTNRMFYSLSVADLLVTIPADGKVYVVGGFTSLFQAPGTVEELLTPSQPISRSYADFIEVMLAHDSSDPVGVLRFGAFYL